jgi:hypothetical protein
MKTLTQIQKQIDKLQEQLAEIKKREPVVTLYDWQRQFGETLENRLCEYGFEKKTKRMTSMVGALKMVVKIRYFGIAFAKADTYVPKNHQTYVQMVEVLDELVPAKNTEPDICACGEG